MMHSAILRGISVGVLLVLHQITTFFTDDSKGKLMARRRTFSTRSPPMPKFNAFIEAKYSFHTLGHLLRLATVESSYRRVKWNLYKADTL